MHGVNERTSCKVHVNGLPVETLTAILFYLSDPTAPIDESTLLERSRARLDLKSPPAFPKVRDFARLGWLPAAWACQKWRSVVLSQAHYRIPIMPHEELSLAVLASLSPLSVDLHIDEEEWIRNESAALTLESIFQSYGHRMRSLHVWTSVRLQSMPASGSLLPNAMRDLDAPALEEFQAVGKRRQLVRRGCLGPGFRDRYPRAISFPIRLSRSLRVLDLSACTVANASALRACAPITARIVACPGIWDRKSIRPDSGIISDRDGVTAERFSIPFLFDALRYLHLDEDSMPSKEALAALGKITLPVLEVLHLSGLLPKVQDTLEAFVFPQTACVEIKSRLVRQTTNDQDALEGELSSSPFYNALAAKYLNNAMSCAFITRMDLEVDDTSITLACFSNDNDTRLSIHLYYEASAARGRPTGIPNFILPAYESFLVGAFSVFSGVRELAVSSSSRRCQWCSLATSRLSDVKKLVLDVQDIRPFLEFCGEMRADGGRGEVFPVLEEVKLHVRHEFFVQATQLDRLLRAEQEARAQPFLVSFRETHY
ncbi:hypothetical protein PENSPDRAFT_653746 [Peniophora sp. CONT]|nr:hypothetical protein PENSPDRAFT_653746 [Peniophora sp. CONT]